MMGHNLPPYGEATYLGATTHLEATGLGIEYFQKSSENSEFHTHEFVEFLFVLRGTFQHITGDHIYTETAGGLAIVNYNQFHGTKVPVGTVDVMNIYWNPEKYSVPDLPEPLSTRLHELIPAHPMMGHRLNRIVRLQLENPKRTSSLLKMLFEEQNKAYSGSEAVIAALFRVILIQICRSASIIPAGNLEESNPRMEKIRIYLEKHYTEPIRLEQLCELSGLKQANLCRQFKKYTNLSIGSYLQERRLATAMQQLRNSSKKIMTICHDCGFPDLPHFNVTFRKTTGQTPSDYRKSFLDSETAL